MVKKYLKKIMLNLMSLFSAFCYAQNVNIPDQNFKNTLLNNTSINTNGDGEISIEEAEAFSGYMNLFQKQISDLTGIEYFVNLIELNCYGNYLTSLDVSNNTALTILSCNSNQLTSLSVNGATALTDLYCQSNNITSLDVSNNTALTSLSCQDNQLVSLNISNSNNGNIIFVEAHGNPDLNCIQHDEGFDPSNFPFNENSWGGWKKDDDAEWNTDCQVTSLNGFGTIVTSMYPNPVKDLLTISWEDTTIINEVEIYNLAGKRVFTQKVTGNSATINVHSLPSGNYLIKIGNTYKKIIIE